MCGIAGFCGRGDEGTLRRMGEAIAHRGPDAEGFWSEGGVFLGHRRLSIVDVEGGAQPMWTADGEVGIIFNGEIYNHLELRAELEERGCPFQTDHSDTETLLQAYREWGEDFVTRLNGMWAFVLYDRPRRRLLASRDRFGKKPFYYFYEQETFGFASELSALRQHPACPRELAELSVQKFFAYGYVPAPSTVYRRVYKLPGGHSLSFDLPARELQVWRYWSYELEPDEGLAQGSTAALEEELRAVLERAVARRLMADVPLGIFLSGGLDSSAVAALAAKHVPAGELRTFAIGFDEPSFDESTHARTVAAALGTQHFEEVCGLERSLELWPEIIARLDEPLGDGSLLPTYLLSRFTRQQVTVALGGDGGDELFAGYDPFRALRAAEKYARLVPGRLHEAVRLLAGRLPVSHSNMAFDFKVKRTLMGLSYPPALWHPVWMGGLEPRALEEAFRTPAKVEEIYAEAIALWDGCAQTDFVDRALQFWTQLYLQDGILAKVDRASMMCSLEARSPFLDVEMADLARRIPSRLKLRGGQTKSILKKALEPLLPRGIVHRKKKGFGMPIGRWLREGKFAFDGPMPGSLRAGFVQRMLGRHMFGKGDERLFLWSQWVFSEWMKRHWHSALEA